jgi:hypothetical protein
MRKTRNLLLPLSLFLVVGALLAPPATVAMPPQCDEGGYCLGGYCGDGTCSRFDGEDCGLCPDDCGFCESPVCGDAICQSGESCSSCSADCGSCPVNTSDGHAATCDGWDRQGACALSFVGVPTGVEFRRLRGGGGYAWQTFLTWNSAEFNGFGRFTVADGSVGLISTAPLSGQVPLYRWSARRGFVFSTYFVSAHDYVYGGVAGYVWPAGTNQGYPLYRFYSDEYGFFYTNFPQDIRCQPSVHWQFDGEIARVNWPAPAIQATRVCFNNQSLGIPGTCDPFAAARCSARGSVFNFGNCTCFDGLP